MKIFVYGSKLQLFPEKLRSPLPNVVYHEFPCGVIERQDPKSGDKFKGNAKD